jgi:hypothetical protein
MRPEDVWGVDEECQDDYAEMVDMGRATARELDTVVVSIARNAMPLLENTVGLVDEVQAGFRDCRWYVFENDSADGTGEFLEQQASTRPWMTVDRETLGGIDSRGFETERTTRLAYCRNKCHEWVRTNAAKTAWTIVLDVDPQYGFSVDGVFNSIGWLGRLMAGARPRPPGAMAAYSLLRTTDAEGRIGVAGYDAWAARPTCWWRDRRNEVGFQWFSLFLPPVGAPPLMMNSAFGGLCVYRTEAFLAAGPLPYEGGDCEHVALHRKMHATGYQLYMNPGSRYIAIWQ